MMRPLTLYSLLVGWRSTCRDSGAQCVMVSSRFGFEEADVACRQLGFYTVNRYGRVGDLG